MVRRWYQALDIDGLDPVYEDYARKDSKFWNEGKWDNFIAPLLPAERQTFLELGCNAGLFLHKATEAGFQRVTGVESSGQIMKQAHLYRAQIHGEYDLINQAVGTNFEPESIPLSDVILLANVHYHFTVHAFQKLLDVIRSRALYCIIVSAQTRPRIGKPRFYPAEVRGYFKDWPELRMIENINPDGDPSPREQMFSMLFQGGLRPISVDGFFDKWYSESQDQGHRSHSLAPVMLDFFERVIQGDEIDYSKTAFYEYWQTRQPDRDVDKWLRYKAELAQDMKENGMKDPIYIGSNGKLRDGIHRVCIAKVLGYDHIWARVL